MHDVMVRGVASSDCLRDPGLFATTVSAYDTLGRESVRTGLRKMYDTTRPDDKTIDRRETCEIASKRFRPSKIL